MKNSLKDDSSLSKAILHNSKPANLGVLTSHELRSSHQRMRQNHQVHTISINKRPGALPSTTELQFLVTRMRQAMCFERMLGHMKDPHSRHTQHRMTKYTFPVRISESFNHGIPINNALDSSHHHLPRRLRPRNLRLHGRHAQDPIHRATKVHSRQLRVNDGETPSMGSPRDTRRFHSNRHSPNNPRGRRIPTSCGHQNQENQAINERRNGTNQRLPTTLPPKKFVSAHTHHRGPKVY
jgi:hypothetical protein